MDTRRPCALPFYDEATPATIEGYLRGFEPPTLAAPAIGGLVPHAGWIFSGRTAARVFATLQHSRPAPRTFVFLGALHHVAAPLPAVDPGSLWQMPWGPIAVNAELARGLVAAGIGLEADADIHREEHSIEVSLPFIHHFFPGADFVPILCPPRQDAAPFGAALGRALQGKDVVILVSTDLTHYGDAYGFAPAGERAPDVLAFMEQNDRRILDMAARLEPDGIVAEARSHANACGSGALAAGVAAAKQLGARAGVLVEYRTSCDVRPEDPVRRAVGYGGMVFA